MVAHHLTDPSAENNNNLTLLRGMSQTLAFMGMSINRAMDFGKSAFNIELKPTIRPLNAMDNMKQILEFVSWDDPSISDLIIIAPVPHDFPTVGLTDISWFQENMICLMTNAVKYSGKPMNISVQIKMCHKFAQFSVVDSGVELSDLALSQIFDPPLQGSRSQTGGMGLGLVCLAERVKALGGEYGAQKRTGDITGTTIWFRIPFLETISVPKSPHPKKSQEKIKEISLRSTQKKKKKSVPQKPECTCLVFPEIPRSFSTMHTTSTDMLQSEISKSMISKSVSRDDDVLVGLKLLIVDDCVTILKMISFILSKAGAKVTQAKNGLDAVKEYTGMEFDIIISDIQMPVLDGFGLAKEIRATEATVFILNPNKEDFIRKQIIIGISADGNNREEALHSGMDAFLMKPFKLEDLVEEYARIVEERKQDMDSVVDFK
eukprot:CAMPEP_0119035910 /NCGR_PEP_ID=MMETSP1177-20130426/3188_1 /TAXON_ID=2985 /ORGANISM="Ochromonas sp, Strain CCMP1899" /LENGTH=432 /DNA_ID=CAMNT_0006994821 /DNA_START=1547 /DNA_END=2845 /DNA_ORIENTATION=-